MYITLFRTNKRLTEITWPRINIYFWFYFIDGQPTPPEMSTEAKLLAHLFQNYNPNARPVIKPEHNVNLKYDIALKQLLKVVRFCTLWLPCAVLFNGSPNITPEANKSFRAFEKNHEWEKKGTSYGLGFFQLQVSMLLI